MQTKTKAGIAAGFIVAGVMSLSVFSCVVDTAYENRHVIIDRYEEFYGLCQQVQSSETAIAQAERALALAVETDASQRELLYLQTELRGAIGLRDTLATRYNANAQMMTRSWFRGHSLPDRIALYTEDGERTSCGSF
jgi:hypothetical protein